ncbi:MFS transporter [Nonomuraea sp. NPDC003707]
MTSSQQATLREVLEVGEFRALLIAHGGSQVGDQLARVALAVLVLQRTGSAALTTLTYALTFLPELVSGPLLAGLADRYARRSVMVTADLLRAILVAVMAWPGLPLPVLGGLVICVVMLNAPFEAARLATMPVILAGDRYPVAMGLTGTVNQAVQLAGFSGGGVLVGILGPHAAFAVDAATFLVSAALIRVFLSWRPAVARDGAARRVWRGFGLVRGDARLRYLFVLYWLYGFFVVPEGLAGPYAAQIGAGPAAIGLLMAADPVCAAVGAFLITRFVPPQRRQRLMAPLAVATGLPLLGFALAPGLPVALVLLGLCGLLSSYLILIQPAFMPSVPEDQRGQVVGLAVSGLIAAQGLGILASGPLAEVLRPGDVVAVFAALGILVACLTTCRSAIDRTRVTCRRESSRSDSRPPLRLPAPEEPLSFEAHIKQLFRPQDRRSMSFAFDLWSCEDVSHHAEAILDRLREGTMPCDGAWPQERIEFFARWVKSGKPE